MAKDFAFVVGKYYKLVNIDKEDSSWLMPKNNKVLRCEEIGNFPCDARLEGIINRCYRNQILKNKIIEVSGPYDIIQEEFEV